MGAMKLHPFYYRQNSRAGQASPADVVSGVSGRLSGVQVKSTTHVAAQARGTGSCHSFFSEADRDLPAPGALQAPLLPSSQEHGINSPAEHPA